MSEREAWAVQYVRWMHEDFAAELDRRRFRAASPGGQQVGVSELAGVPMSVLKRIERDLRDALERTDPPTATAKPAEVCTGIAATWCPVHGDCTCPHCDDNPYADRTLTDESCPLHSSSSTHGETVESAEVCASAEVLTAVRELHEAARDASTILDWDMGHHADGTPVCEYGNRVGRAVERLEPLLAAICSAAEVRAEASEQHEPPDRPGDEESHA